MGEERVGESRGDRGSSVESKSCADVAQRRCLVLHYSTSL